MALFSLIDCTNIRKKLPRRLTGGMGRSVNEWDSRRWRHFVIPEYDTAMAAMLAVVVVVVVEEQ
eukprot:COSAG02_NODE_18127_length_959_cov_0.941860_1_plen_64_part_00